MKVKSSVRNNLRGPAPRKTSGRRKSPKDNFGRSGRKGKVVSRRVEERPAGTAENDRWDAEKPLPRPQSEVVRIFDRLFRSFRLQVFEHFGGRCEEVIARAEKKICLLSPEYDRLSLTDETAPLMLDVVGEIVDGAPFFKRPKLRRAAVALISDLYNKHYPLLEQGNMLDRVEQAYYRLKT